jgi:hypothetical protein
MEKNLCQIIYISESLIDGDDFQVAAALEKITSEARDNNAALGITGALMSSGRYFAQVIEGPEAAVMKLFTVIGKDPRHTDVHGLSFEPIAQRRFADWSMALVSIEPEALLDIEKMHRPIDNIEASKGGKRILEMMAFVVSSRARSLAYIEAKAGPLEHA